MVRFDCGSYHTLVVTENLELLAWGGNYYGQVGNGTTADAYTPQEVIKAGVTRCSNDSIITEGVIACAAGRSHSLAVTTAGEVYAWGNNDDMLLGTGWKLKQELPTKVIDGGVKAVAAGWNHSLALTEAGEVFAWGGNDYGQLGDGTRTPRRSPVKVHINVGNRGARIKEIRAGWFHNLAITEEGHVLQWGFTSQDASTGQLTLTPQMIIDDEDCLREGEVKEIAAGGSHSLALTDQGRIWAWGGNENGQLGDGTMGRRMKPVIVASNIMHIAAGNYHSVAIDDNWCILQWGFKMACVEDGDGSWDNETTPAKVEKDGGAYFIAAGGVHSLLISHSGEAWTWGGNSCGQIGNGEVTDAEIPVCVVSQGAVETVPESERKAMILANCRAEDETAAINEKEKQKRIEKLKTASDMRAEAARPQVPELMHKMVGDYHPSPLNSTYPLAFNGCSGPASSSLRISRSASAGTLQLVGFVPRTGFRPGPKVNATNARSWPDGPDQAFAQIIAAHGISPPERRRKRSVVHPQARALEETLPEGWAARKSTKNEHCGATYYVNLLTGKSTWDVPKEPALKTMPNEEIQQLLGSTASGISERPQLEDKLRLRLADREAELGSGYVVGKGLRSQAASRSSSHPALRDVSS